MKRSKNRLINILRRHRFLFYIRFLLLARNAGNRETCCFNDYNKAGDMPGYFSEINSKMHIDPSADSFEKARQIATYLRSNIKTGPAVSLSSEETLKKMFKDGGVCSDFSQVFNVFCLINNIRVKEWHIVGSLLTNSYGHTLNEVWSYHQQKWIAIDAHGVFCFAVDGQAPYASVEEVFNGLRFGKKVRFIFLSHHRPKLPDRLSLLYSKDTIPYIIDRYQNRRIDYFLNKFSRLPAVAINAMLIILGWNYRFVFPIDNYRRHLFPIFYR